MSGHAALSIALAVVVVAVLAVALIEVRTRLHSISEKLATLAGALETVESEHLRPLEPAVTAINAQFDTILGALPGIAKKAAVVAERRPA
jgi:cob(I)alamin adenosyltransferase